MEIEISDVREEDLPQIEDIEKECFSMPWTHEQLKGQIKDDRHEFIAAKRGGELIGYVGMMYILDEGYISNVAVRPDYRRAGIGGVLVDALLEIAGERGLSFVTLEARESNKSAIGLYEKHGFLKVGERKNYYSLPKETAVLMTKYL